MISPDEIWNNLSILVNITLKNLNLLEETLLSFTKNIFHRLPEFDSELPN